MTVRTIAPHRHAIADVHDIICYYRDCYLQDLYVNKDLRGAGVGRQLIKAVYDAAQTAGSTRVYWQTQDSNTAGRMLYDKVAKHLGFIVYSQEV